MGVLLFASLAFAEVNFSGIPPATDIEDSKARFQERAERVLETNATGALPAYGREGAVGYYSKVMAKFAQEMDIDLVNRSILDSGTRVYSNIGTHFDYVGRLCYRSGDYDFMIHGLSAALSFRPDLLSASAKSKLLGTLLNARGSNHHTHFRIGICGRHRDTENHVLMSESARYLTNQLLQKELRAKGSYEPSYDNQASGFNAWITSHLQQFLKNDFEEYNSRPYEGYTISAVQNFYDFAESDKVRMGARLVLDYLAAKFAIQSNGLRRSTPFRRQPKYRTEPNVFLGDNSAGRYMMLVGNYGTLSKRADKPNEAFGGSAHMVRAAIGNYRVPDLVADLMIDKKSVRYYQRFKHLAPEIYYSSPSFLISAGGHYLNRFDAGTNQQDGWSVPTTIMPTHGGYDRGQYLRFEGSKHYRFRSNLCVAPNFACGLAPKIPASIPASCMKRYGSMKRGEWTFINFNSSACPLRYGFYAMVYRKKCDSLRCKRRASDYGFMETREATAESFDQFVSGVLERNSWRRFDSRRVSTYVTAEGDAIRFSATPLLKHTDSIVSFNGRANQRNTKRWPLASGDIMSSTGDGWVRVRNPKLRRELVLDYRDGANPRRMERSY